MNHKLAQDSDIGEAAERGSSAGGSTGWTARIIGLAVILVLLRPTDAWAYVDPSTGGYLLQVLLAGILAAAVAIRLFWRNVRLFFRNLFSGSSHDETSENDPTR